MAMKVVEVNVGEKIPYTVSKTKVTFDDELMLNLAKLERDFDVSVDICIDKFGMLVTGLGVKYAAQIEIPARQYVDKEQVNPDYEQSENCYGSRACCVLYGQCNSQTVLNRIRR